MTEPPTGGLSGRLRAALGGGRYRFWIAAVLVLLIGVRLALPWGLARIIESQGRAQLGRVVQVGDVDLGLLAGRAAVEDLLVGALLERVEAGEPVDPDLALLRFDRLDVDLSWLKLLRGEVALSVVELAAPRVRVIRGEDGRLVRLRAARPAPEEEETKEPEEDDGGAGWPIVLDRLRVSDLDLLLVNLARPRPPISLAFGELTLADLAFRDGEISIGPVGLQTAQVRVLRDLDLSGIAGDDAVAELVEEEALALGAEQIPPQPPPSYSIDEVAVQAASFALIVGEEEIEASLSLSAREVTGDQDRRFPIELDLGLDDGSVALRGEVGVTPVHFEGTLEWTGLPLPVLVHGAAPSAPLRLASGASAGALDLEVHLAQVAEQGDSRISAKGRVEVTAFEAELDEPRATVGWKTLEVEIAEAALAPPGSPGAAPPRIELAVLRLHAPQLRATRSAPAAAPSPPAEESADEAPAPDASTAESESEPELAPSPELRVAVLELTDGSADVRDETVSPPHRTQIGNLEVRGSGLRWPEADASELVVSGRTAGEGTFAMNVAGRDGGRHVDLDLKDVVLPPYSAYAADSAGYWIEAGQLSLEAGIDLAADGTRIESDIVLQRLDVAEVKSGSFEREFGMPLDLALALLRDPSGRISLPLDASFGSDQTDVALTGIVLAALRQAIIGALTSPLKAAGLLLPSGEKAGGVGLEGLALEPGTRDAGVAADARLAGYAGVLDERPGLGLVLRGRAGEADDRALAEEILIEAVREDAELPAVSAGFLQRRRLRGALKDRGRGEEPELNPEDAAALEGWIESVRVPEERRRALADERAEAARQRLASQHGVDAERLSVGDPFDGEPGVVIELAPLDR